MVTKHGGEQFSCDECSYKGTRKQSLKSHMAFKHDGKQLLCEKCDYQSASKHSLKLHTQSKHDGIRYAYGAFKIHKLIHTGEKPF